MRAELRLDRSYQPLTAQTMASANRRARTADVPGLERLLLSIQRRDAALGARRPDAVARSSPRSKRSSTRRGSCSSRAIAGRCARRNSRRYRVAIGAPMDLFTELQPPLEGIKSLAGSPPPTLMFIQRRVARILKLVAAIAPPEEVAAAHALLVSAVQLAGNAAEIRREAVLAGDMTRAWDASSAAAGALMLGAKARADIQSLLRLPQLR